MKINYIDVFSNRLLKGNPVAVVFDGDNLSQTEMQAIAKWTNLSETTFVLKSEIADYKLKIFTPNFELPFAGHPTIGSAFAALKNGIVQNDKTIIHQECAVGIIEVYNNSRISFKAPNYSFIEFNDIPLLEESLSAKVIGTPKTVDIGPKWLIAEIASGEEVLNIKPDLQKIMSFEKTNNCTGLTIFGKYANGEIEVRSFAPSDGINEDPACGSGNAAVCAYRLDNNEKIDDYIANQGRAINRDGKIYVNVENGSIFVGGDCVLGIEGSIEL